MSQHLDLLQPTGNVLAIQTMNFSATDADLLVLPELSQIVYHGIGEHFFSTPTPGAPNAAEYWYRVDDTQFSVDRGFYTEPFSLVISTDTPDATIHYSLNGATPAEADNTKTVTSITRSDSTATATIAGHGYANGDWVLIRGATEPEYNGVFVISGVTTDTFDYTVAGTPATPATGTITAQANYYTYTDPITIDRTTTVRAAAFKTAYAATDIDTQTYVFLDDILVQPADPPGWPTSVERDGCRLRDGSGHRQRSGVPRHAQGRPPVAADDVDRHGPGQPVRPGHGDLCQPACGRLGAAHLAGVLRSGRVHRRVPGQCRLEHLRRLWTQPPVQEALAARGIQGDLRARQVGVPAVR